MRCTKCSHFIGTCPWDYLYIDTDFAEDCVDWHCDNDKPDVCKELISRNDCDLFVNYETIINELMNQYNLTWKTNPDGDFSEAAIYEFACKLLQKAQNIIDSSDTIAYEKTFKNFAGESIHYLSWSDDNDDEQDY